MKPFQFRLQSLLDLRLAERNQRRAELAQALKAERILQERQQAIQSQAESLRAFILEVAGQSTVNVDALLEASRHRLVLDSQRKTLDEQFSQLGEAVESRRRRLVEADRAVKALEKLRERHWQEHQRLANLAEIRELDEVGQRRWQPGTLWVAANPWQT